VTRDEFEGIDIQQELREARPWPSEEFATRLISRVHREEPRRVRVLAPRAIVALAATATALVVAGAFGGISEAAFTVEGAVSAIVHIGQKTPHHPAVATSHQAGASHRTSGSTSQGGFVRSGGAQLPKFNLPNSPAQAQYNPICPGPTRSMISCRFPTPG
jgi:hypothetical protein